MGQQKIRAIVNNKKDNWYLPTNADVERILSAVYWAQSPSKYGVVFGSGACEMIAELIRKERY